MILGSHGFDNIVCCKGRPLPLPLPSSNWAPFRHVLNRVVMGMPNDIPLNFVLVADGSVPSKGATMQKHDQDLYVLVPCFQGNFLLEGLKVLLHVFSWKYGSVSGVSLRTTCLIYLPVKYVPCCSAVIQRKIFMQSYLFGPIWSLRVRGLYVLQCTTSPIGSRSLQS